MTPAQNRRYWKVWGEVKNLLTTWGEYFKDDADAERKAVHREVLGCDKSSKDRRRDRPTLHFSS